MPEIGPVPDDGVSGAAARNISRRGFIGRLGLVLTGAAGFSTLLALESEDADAFHFCGHIYTTGSCPHPTGIPRIDAKGYPLRARDGKQVDDLGRVINPAGIPVDGAGLPLLDFDGRPLAPAPRSRVCQDGIPERYGIDVTVDGAWYRCCGGRVRKLIDCCSKTSRRINGDEALTGYCYSGRKVFCVMYYQTDVPC
ncbi:MAG TPA: hypothetical protein VGO97_03565 [Solirubrobacterales bacterium]|jgi:hypothetical protein|nr:hypothetical protein [Solirubrobacterales bacterium]